MAHKATAIYTPPARADHTTLFPTKKAPSVSLGCFSILIFRMAVLPSSLLIVVPLAQRLKVVRIVLHLLVPSERNDVVDHFCLRILSFRKALHTQRMCIKVPASELLPPCIVTASVCRAHVLRVERLVLVAVLLPTLDKLRTARVAARVFRLYCHASHFFP